MVVHAGEVSPTFVTSDFNQALKTQRKHTHTRVTVYTALNQANAAAVKKPDRRAFRVNWKIRLETRFYV